MNIIIERLSEKHLDITDAFSCIESNEKLQSFNSKERRRIKKHSKEMEDFLKNEALADQNKGLNTTHLFINNDLKEIVGYVSLCNDSVKLEITERAQLGFIYANIPAIKIARLAVSNKYHGQGYGKLIIDYSAYFTEKIRKICGLSLITLDCYKHRISYYEKYGFKKNQLQPKQRAFDTPISMRCVLNDYLESVN